MSSAVSTRSTDQPRWWSLKSQSSSSSLNKQQTNGTLGALASAIGFRSKKSPTLTIQQPQLSVRPIITSPLDSPSRPRTSPAPTTRPASKSVSSTRSRGDSIGPRTPVDSPPFHRQSLLTLSDIDPFAARAITVQHSPTDPNRLSAWSNSSDYNKNDIIIGRDSYASSSSHSNYNGGEHSPLHSPVDTPPPLSPNKRRKQPVDADASWQSFNAVAEQNRYSQPHPPPIPRPPMRARGMTDGGSGLHPRFFRNEPPVPISTPPLTRHVSGHAAGRVPGPTTAPPSHQLPRPPIDDGDAEASPASISFASVMRDSNYVYDPKGIADLARLSFNDTDASLHAPRSLKKAVSQQSLTKNVVLPYPPSAPTSPTEPSVDRSLRKQRSFHHPRIPLPSIPMPFQASSSSQGPVVTSPEVSESRRSSTNGPSTPSRKRLFSSSSVRRSSTSHHAPAEDDERSLFSLRSDSHGKNINSSTSNIAAHPSFWDESNLNTPSSPEWHPQQIMSPAEMARLEAKMEQEQTGQVHRKRGMSVLSSSSTYTSMSDRDLSQYSRGPPTRTSSHIAKVPTDGMQGTPTPSASTQSLVVRTSESSFISLAPPPRSWQRPPTANTDHHPSGFQPLSPPPRNKIRKKVSAERTISLEKSMRRRSLMRKPSFLDIGDDKDTDTEEDVAVKGSRPPEGSFLDLARESFDTIRSSEE